MAGSLSPIYQNDLRPWTLSLTNRDGSALDLTGLINTNITVKLQRVDSPSTVIVGGGTVAIQSPATAGIITYAPVSGDVSTPATYQLWVIIAWPAGVQHRDPYELEIKSAP